MRTIYTIYGKMYEKSTNHLNTFYGILGDNTLASSAHRSSPLRGIIKAITELEDSKYAVDTQLSDL